MNDRHYIGIDIGGTKCAVTVGRVSERGGITVLGKRQFPTEGTPNAVLGRFDREACGLLKEAGLQLTGIAAAGISCGGPLDAENGLILSPPNLPGWDHIPVVEHFHQAFGVPVYLENDANACAVAEWQFGAARGFENVIFLTFGTGLGAGLILNGRLYRGTGGNAGEIGHVRLRKQGPVGYGKPGSAEGFCSGGGIGRYACAEAIRHPQEAVPLLARCGTHAQITAKTVAQLADEGDPFCREIYRRCGKMLGETLAILLDLFDPQCVVIGGVYMRSAHLLTESMQQILRQEALPMTRGVCRILPASLGEQIGDYAALAVAKYRSEAL